MRVPSPAGSSSSAALPQVLLDGVEERVEGEAAGGVAGRGRGEAGGEVGGVGRHGRGEYARCRRRDPAMVPDARRHRDMAARRSHSPPRGTPAARRIPMFATLRVSAASAAAAVRPLARPA